MAEWHKVDSEEEDEEEESLPSIPEGDAELVEKVRCTSASCAWRSQWLGSCGCPFVLKEVAGVMAMCAEEDRNRQEE